jgi:tetratricopeptide (TPR) repeat protein
MPPDSTLMTAGIEHHRAGRFGEAEQIYRRLLTIDPRDAVVLNLLGAVYLNLNRPAEAGQFLAQALQVNPRFAAAHDNWGILMMSQNRLVEAIASFRQGTALDPNNASTQLNLANALKRNGQLAEAIEAFRRGVQLAPEAVAARGELAKLLFEQGRREEAVPHFREVARLKPSDPQAHFELADALTQTGMRQQAIAAYQETLRLNPDLAQACVNLAFLHIDARNYVEAERYSRRAVELRPQFAEAHHNLGCALMKLERYQEALAALEESARLKPGMPEAYNNMGVALAEEGHYAEAMKKYEHSLTLRSENPEALFNVGNVHVKLGNFDTALAYFDRAIALRPDYGEARHNRSACWLLQGNFTQGLPEYEWRFRSRDYPRTRLNWKVWNGESLTGRTIVLASEQGIGDTLQFVRYAPLVKELGARVVVGCAKSQHALLSRSAGIDAFTSPDVPTIEADFCVPMMSLPYRMGTRMETIPAQVPYLFADESLLDKWREYLAGYDGFKVGLVWQGNPECPGDRSRSFALERYAPLAKVPGVRLFNLQHGPGVEQLAAVAGDWPIESFSDDIDKESGAFMDTAAIMKNLDLVITSDTAAAHLAGALGVPVWMPLQFVPDWRWLVEREDSPWYPTMRIFRQPKLADWPPVFERLASELARLVAEHR